MPFESIGVLVPTDRIARVIGKLGCGLRQVREVSGCKVQVQQSVESNPQTRRVDLTGNVEQLACGFDLVIRKAFAGEQSCAPVVMIPSDKAGLVVGKGGNNLKRVREDYHVRVSLEKEAVVDPLTNIEERELTMQGDLIQMSQAFRCILGPSSLCYFGVPRCLMNSHAPGLVATTFPFIPERVASPDPDKIQLHVIVPARFAGAFLGKGGAQLKQTASTACCRVSMTSRDGNPDRRVVIIGGYDQCTIAQDLVFRQLQEATRAAGLDLPELSTVFLIRKEAAGSVIGKQGATLKQIREQSGSQIKLDREEVEGHRHCTITGDFQNILQAERTIFDIVRNVPVEHSCPLYGSHPMLAYESPIKRLDVATFPIAPIAKRQRVDEATTKLLVPAQSAGIVIGKQGLGLKQIRERYGVQVDMLQQSQAPQWQKDRVVILKGPVASRQAAADFVLKTAFQVHRDPCSLKMLIPALLAGSVIGKQGCTLKTIREQCGISAQVEKYEIMGERLVTATGPHSQVSAAASAICLLLEKAIQAQAEPSSPYASDMQQASPAGTQCLPTLDLLHNSDYPQQVC